MIRHSTSLFVSLPSKVYNSDAPSLSVFPLFFLSFSCIAFLRHHANLEYFAYRNHFPVAEEGFIPNGAKVLPMVALDRK